MTVSSGYINWNYCWVVFSVVGLVNQPCLSVLLFLKFILQSKTAVKLVPCAQLYLVVTEKIMVCLATQVMMGIISTGITEGKGRAGVMIPIPGYSMYQARLLQHITHQEYLFVSLGVASRVACSRSSNSRTQCLGEIVPGRNKGRVGREQGNSPSLVAPVIFFPR